MSQVHRGGVLFINNLPAAHTGPGGCASAPEECWVTVAGQKVKQSFTNMVYAKDFKSVASQVFLHGYPLLTLASYAAQSYGDAESEGGVISGTTQGEAYFKSFSPNVFYEGNPAIRHGERIQSNSGNTEITSWVQPMIGSTASSKLVSDKIENLAHPFSLNIQLIRKPEHELTPSKIQQSFLVKHEKTGRIVYNTYGVFKSIDNQFIYHGDQFEEGTYTVEEFYQKNAEMIYIPLGKIKTAPKDSTTPGMKLVPLRFKRYNEPHIDDREDSISTPYPENYIYLFKDGYIWRVFYMNHLHRMNEFDLSTPFKKISQDAQAQLNQGVLLPIEDAEGTHEFHVAVSKLALSWNTLHQLGGINPNDTRFTAKDHLPIPPDRQFIKRRLQKIDVALLMTQADEEIVASNKSDSLHAPTLKNLKREALDYQPIPGGISVVLDDPLSRFYITASYLLTKHIEHLAYLKDNSEQYALAELVGKMLESVKHEGQYYTHRVNEEERLAYIAEYNETCQAHHDLMKKGLDELKIYHEATKERGQMDDFARIPLHRDYVDPVSLTFRELFQNIYSALLITPDGLDFLKEEVEQDNSLIMQGKSFVEMVSKVSPLPTLVHNTAGLLATVLAPNSENFEKIIDFYQKTLRVQVNARLVSVNLDEVLDYHQSDLTRNRGAASTYLKVQTGSVTRLSSAMIKPPSGNTIKIVMIDDVPLYEFFRFIPGSNSPSFRMTLDKVNHYTSIIKNSAHFQGVLSCLSVFSALSVGEQLRALKNAGDLKEGDYHILHLDLVRHLIVATHFSAESYLMTRQISRGMISEAGNSVANKLNFYGVVAGVIIDFYYTKNYLKSSENGLALGHGLGFLGGIGDLLAMYRLARNLPRGNLYLTLAILLTFIGAALVMYFTKSEIEQWLFEGPWGKTEKERKTPEESLEKYYFLTALVRIEKAEARTAHGEKMAPTPAEKIIENIMPDSVKRFLDASPAKPFKPWVFSSQVKTLLLTLSLPIEIEAQVKTKILVNGYSGTRNLESHEVQETAPTLIYKTTQWGLVISQDHFGIIGPLCRIFFEIYDLHSQTLIGKDAYLITYNIIHNDYEIEKVAYEFTH